MEQLVKKESQKLLEKQMREARIQRQKQVRQQTMAWTESTRKKFEEGKERGIKSLSQLVTEQVQAAAIENIKVLTKQNDLALAEIGMAHRAAAGMQQVERLKSLKRLKHQELAKSRGAAAMSKLIKERESQAARSMVALKRKEDVRRAEDSKSRDLISRRPLISVSNVNVNENKRLQADLRPPKFNQSIAKTLQVPDAENSRSETSQRAHLKARGKLTVSIPEQASSSRDMASKKKPDSKGVLSEMIRIKAINSAAKPSEGKEGKVVSGLGLRSKYMKANPQQETDVPGPSYVRYFDVTIPKGEMKYVAPKGLAVKESSSNPDAWETVQRSSLTKQDEQNQKSQREEELKKKADERGKLAMKKAILEKKLVETKNELLQEIDQDIMGSGEQQAYLGLEDNSDENDAVGTLGGGGSQQAKNKDTSISSDEFSIVDSDEDYDFPDASKSKSKKKKPENEPVPGSSKKGASSPGAVKDGPKNQREQKPATARIDEVNRKAEEQAKLLELRGSIENIPPLVHEANDVSISSDGFSTVGESDGEYEFPPSPLPKDKPTMDESNKSKAKDKADLKTSKQRVNAPPQQTNLKSSKTRASPVDESSSKTLTNGHSSKRHSPHTSQSISTPSSFRHSDGSNNGDTPMKVILTVNQTPDSSSGNRSGSTDYYNPPDEEADGPYTSTPDGKMSKKKPDKQKPDKKSRVLSRYFSKMTQRLPESIEELQVSTSPSTRVRIDAELISSHNTTSATEESSMENQTPSRHKDKPKRRSTGTGTGSDKSIQVILDRNGRVPRSDDTSEFESGSTVAEANAVIIGTSPVRVIVNQTNLTDSTNSGSHTNLSSSYNSGELPSMLGALSQFQLQDKQRSSGAEGYDVSSSSDPSGSGRYQSSSPDSTDNSKGGQRGSNTPNTTLQSSGVKTSDSDSINQNTSDYLKEMLTRQKKRAAKNSSRSESSARSSARSGPDREMKRVELLEDITPVKLFDTPPSFNRSQNQSSSGTDQLTAVFENLINKWSQVKIDPPPPWVLK